MSANRFGRNFSASRDPGRPAAQSVPKESEPQRPSVPPMPKQSADDIVEFKLTAPNARSVRVAGTFNNWNADRSLMAKEAEGVWRIRIPMTAGRHEYRFIVDGQWMEDPLAKDSAANPYGSRNSVVNVKAAASSRAFAHTW